MSEIVMGWDVVVWVEVILVEDYLREDICYFGEYGVDM